MARFLRWLGGQMAARDVSTARRRWRKQVQMNESTIPPAIPGGPDGAEVTSGDGPAMNQIDGNTAGANRGSVISSPEDFAALIPAVTASPVQIAAAEPLAGGFAPEAAPATAPADAPV